MQGSDGKDLLKYVFDDIFKNEIKFIITDENMEIVNGSNAVRFIRDIEKRRFLKKNNFILASSDNPPNFKDNGFDYSINKPINIQELESVVNKILK